MSEYISTKDSPASDKETIERLSATVTHLAWLLEDVLENGVAKKGRTNDSREAADQWLEDRWEAIKSARLEANGEPSGASGGSLANYSAIPNSCLRGSTAEQRFCEPPVAGSTPAAGLCGEWIPVTERLPDEYEHVLGWNRGWCRAAEVWRNTGGEWRGGDYESVGRITHWTPLPAPPTDAE